VQTQAKAYGYHKLPSDCTLVLGGTFIFTVTLWEPCRKVLGATNAKGGMRFAFPPYGPTPLKLLFAQTNYSNRDGYWVILFLDLNASGHKGNTAIQELTCH
jgi:hypothetical protein